MMTYIEETVENEYGSFVIGKLSYDERTHDIILNDWDSYILPFILELGTKRTVVQAGGWQGLYAILLSKYFSRVYTFEADQSNFSYLVRNCISHRVDNIFKFECALGSSCGITFLESTLTTGQHRINHDGYIVHEQFREQPAILTPKPKITIDSLNIPDCDLILLDVEGYESFALTGALQTIEKYKPAIIVEEYWKKSDHLNNLISFLNTQYGYKIKAEFPQNKILTV